MMAMSEASPNLSLSSFLHCISNELHARRGGKVYCLSGLSVYINVSQDFDENLNENLDNINVSNYFFLSFLFLFAYLSVCLSVCLYY